MKKPKSLILFSGGLDSRLVAKIMEEQSSPTLIFFKLPFGTGCCNEHCSLVFSQNSSMKLKTIDCTKGTNLKKYIEIIKNPKFQRGAGINPCIDCRIFMLNLARRYADKNKIEIIATGEVLGERPLSQNKSALSLVETQAELEGRLLRPLSAKLLKETKAEQSGKLNRDKFFSIHGRKRNKQIELAKKFKISYPNPGGGCLLCEKPFSARLKNLLETEEIKRIKPEEIELLRIGRHFKNKNKIILGRNQQENTRIEKLNKKLKYSILIPEYPGPTAVYKDNQDRELAEKLIKAYSENNIEERKKFDKYQENLEFTTH